MVVMVVEVEVEDRAWPQFYMLTCASYRIDALSCLVNGCVCMHTHTNTIGDKERQ